MIPINAVGRVRFSSGRPQRVHLVDASDETSADLLCLEDQQELALGDKAIVLYVVTGTATIITEGGRVTLPAGHLLRPDSGCTLANIGERRLVCLAFGSGK